MGLMQPTPRTAAALGVDDAFDPVQNADAGTRYLGWLSRRYRGDRVRAIAAYNACPARVPGTGFARSAGGNARLRRRTRWRRGAHPTREP